jgi:7-cyano-7-deazaguanine synthase
LDKIAILASGGLDSSILLADEARRAKVYPLYVECGLKWEAAERDALVGFVGALGNANIAPLVTLTASTANMYGDHWSMTGRDIPGVDEPDESVFLPGRNILLLALAAVWCSTHDIAHLAIGSLDGNPFPDATLEFFQDFGRALSVGLAHLVHVTAPYRTVHKAEIIRRFRHLPLELTLTCMSPRGTQHCGNCNKCRERQRGFQEAEVLDPTVYAA